MAGNIVSHQNPIPITYTNRSSTVATANVSKTAASPNALRKTFIIKNPASATEPLYFRIDGVAATANNLSFDLQPGDSYESPPGLISTAAITVLAATATHAYFLVEGQ
jgi:hypothetical protein